jgi:hypothetical protein
MNLGNYKQQQGESMNYQQQQGESMKMRHSPRRSTRLWTLVAAIVLTLAVPGMCEAGEPTRRLFLDDYHIQSMTGFCNNKLNF